MDTPPLPLADTDRPTLPLTAARPDTLDAALAALPPEQRAYATAHRFKAASQELLILPGADGIAGALLGLGEDRGPFAYGGLAFRLPEGTAWHLAGGHDDPATAVLGFCLGGYTFTTFKAPRRAPALLRAPPDTDRARVLAETIWYVRDLVNTPANRLGPAELAAQVEALATAHGATFTRFDGETLSRGYPAVAAVGAGSDRPPVVASFSWRGSGATATSPNVALCGKGVVFDTGGYDLKPSAAMLRMKKDMGGAAIMLGLARAIMARDLPVHLSVRIGCVENSVSGHAMRPSDVIATRKGLSVEIGNTDAEGRLVLSDLLAEACEDKPDLLIDAATLTGAARVALGPDLPALFCNDPALSAKLLDAGTISHDPLWPLPLWDGYDSWLDSPVADLGNVSSKPLAGAVVAALFLRRFVRKNVRWAHLDVYAWNDGDRPGRPEGGEAQALRALFTALEDDALLMPENRNRLVT